MFQRKTDLERPRLLISVRNATEALSALAGGADVIDIKEPNRGSLGAADARILDEVVQVVDGHALVSAAAGELLQLEARANIQPLLPMPVGVELVKIGLAGCQSIPDWPRRLRELLTTLAGHAKPVAVVYADWQSAEAPEPQVVLTEASSLGSPVLLVDTYDKTRGNLLELWPPAELARFVQEVHEAGIAIVLAGSLSGASLRATIELGPDLVAVRGAACIGDRRGTVSEERVRAIHDTLASTGKLNPIF